MADGTGLSVEFSQEALPNGDKSVQTGKSTRSGGPGSARFGNFINYYEFNPADRRIKLIPHSMVENILSTLLSKKEGGEVVALDIGCNAGQLTCALYDHFKRDYYALHVLGVDVDETLIQRSKEANHSPEQITFKMADVMDSNDTASIADYLQTKGVIRFDVVFCFSVTLWIHLNHGDEGLKSFLKFLSLTSKWILLEPQPWKCYKQATRRMKKLDCPTFEHFSQLEWRATVEKDIEQFLLNECNCVLEERLGTTAWDRTLCLFRTSHVSNLK